MKEQRVTYAELKLAKDSKRPQVKPKGSKISTTGTEQGVNYAELSLRNAARDPHENGKSCHLKGLAAPPDKCIAGILGLICLVLICIIVAVWVTSSTTEEPEQNDFSSEQNDCPNVTKSQEEYHCGPCPQGWFSYSNNCYYFSAEKKTWKESVTACQCMKSQLLFIDSEEEMKFMEFIRALSWIGVYRSSSDQPWILVNGSASQLEIRKSASANYHCVTLQSIYYADNCEFPKKYYCKRKM